MTPSSSSCMLSSSAIGVDQASSWSQMMPEATASAADGVPNYSSSAEAATTPLLLQQEAHLQIPAPPPSSYLVEQEGIISCDCEEEISLDDLFDFLEPENCTQQPKEVMLEPPNPPMLMFSVQVSSEMPQEATDPVQVHQILPTTGLRQQEFHDSLDCQEPAAEQQEFHDSFSSSSTSIVVVESKEEMSKGFCCSQPKEDTSKSFLQQPSSNDHEVLLSCLDSNSKTIDHDDSLFIPDVLEEDGDLNSFDYAALDDIPLWLENSNNF